MPAKKATILVVDDEPLLREIFEEWLEAAGYNVLTAENGAEGLAVMNENPVDLVITDVRMPVMDGVAMVRALSAAENQSGRYLPKIIFISGFADVTPREAYDLGVEAMLQKPIHHGDFLHAIRKTLLPRCESWSGPALEAGQSLQMILPRIPVAREKGFIEFGRGGFCLRVGSPYREGLLRFDFAFEAEPSELAGEGYIRWVALAESLIGVEILRLERPCLDWGAGVISANAGSSYIPKTCQAVRAGAPG